MVRIKSIVNSLGHYIALLLDDSNKAVIDLDGDKIGVSDDHSTLTLNGIPVGSKGISIVNSATVTFSGDGTPTMPLSATANIGWNDISGKPTFVSSMSIKEQFSGIYHIDGKKIYQKTYPINIDAGSAMVYISLLIANLNEVVKFEWFVNKGNGGYQSNYYVSASDFLTIKIAYNLSSYDSLIFFKSEVLSNPVNGYATVYYTCTDR